jgi:hypothetical protein
MHAPGEMARSAFSAFFFPKEVIADACTGRNGPFGLLGRFPIWRKVCTRIFLSS